MLLSWQTIFGDDGSQSMFVYQSTFSTLQLQKERALIKFLVAHQKVCIILLIFSNILIFLYSIKFFGYKIEIKFDKDPLVVEQNKYATKIVNAYIVYELDALPKNSLHNFTLKKLLVCCNKYSKKC